MQLYEMMGLSRHVAFLVPLILASISSAFIFGWYASRFPGPRFLLGFIAAVVWILVGASVKFALLSQGVLATFIIAVLSTVVLSALIYKLRSIYDGHRSTGL